MSRKILIDPVSRIEGHAKITVQLDDDGNVSDARFHVTQVRGFEKMTEGRQFHEMPSITSRICGICPVSHLIASSKACDQILAVRIPRTAALLRQLINLAQVVQSHALSFFFLSSPDFLFGHDADPAIRNVFGVMQQHPDTARDGIRLRQFGQEVISLLAKKRVHPNWIVPGGVAEPLTKERRETILAGIPDALYIATRALGWFKGKLDDLREEIRTFANFPTMFMSLTNENRDLEFYDGSLRLIDAQGEVVAHKLDPSRYAEYLGEANVEDTYLKAPYYKPEGITDGVYRVGPLARLNIARQCGTQRADQELFEFRELQRRTPISSSFYYHYARMVEIIYALERIEQILHDPEILDPHVRAHAEPNNTVGIGVSEAPRGTLIHHYVVDRSGVIQTANLIIATGHNHLAINRGVLQAAKHFIHGDHIEEGALNRVEAVVRAFDPCLSCSTHAAGAMPLHVVLKAADGKVLHELLRD